MVTLESINNTGNIKVTSIIEVKCELADGRQLEDKILVVSIYKASDRHQKIF